VRRFSFDPTEGTPVVNGVLSGPNGSRRITLVLDTGAVLTQIHVSTMTMLGYGAEQRIKKAVMIGAGGERHEGELFKCERNVTLGKKIEDFTFGVFDFSELAESGIDGLLGWDLIRQLHIEMDGPKGLLTVF